MKTALLRASAGAIAALLACSANGQSTRPTAVLIENVRIFNGDVRRLSAPSNVLVVGNADQVDLDSADRGAGRCVG